MEWGVYGENVYLDEKTFVWWKKNVCFMGEDLLSCGRTVVCMRRTHLGEGGIKKNIYLVEGDGVHVWFLGNEYRVQIIS